MHPTRPFPGLTGPGRRARWRRSVLRRVAAAGCVGGAVLAGLAVVRPPPAPTVSVVVAARAVPAGGVLGPADLTTARVPLPARQPGAVVDTAALVGRRVGAALAPGEALTATRVVPRTVAEGLRPGHVVLHVGLADPASADVLAAGQPVAVYPAAGGEALARDGTVLVVDPPPAVEALDLGGAGPVRGVVLDLPSASAARVLAGHGGLEGPVLVNVVTGPG